MAGAAAAAVIISSDEMLPSFASEKGVLGLSSDTAERAEGRTKEARAAASAPPLNIIFIVLER